MRQRATARRCPGARAWWLPIVLLSAPLVAAAPRPATQPSREAELTRAKTLNQQTVRLYRAGKYAEAVEPAQEALAIRQRLLGPGGLSVNSLSHAQRRTPDD